MSKNQTMEMSKVIGQIEDELREIKSAKEQAEAVIGSNKALSDSLQALFDSASNVAKALENNAKHIITDTTKKLEMLNVQASDVDSYAQKGVLKISEQSALAQSKLEEDLCHLVQQLIGTISTSTNQSLETLGNELTGYRVLFHEAAQKFSDSASDTMTKQEEQIVEIGKSVVSITNQNLEAVENELTRFHVLVNEVLQKFADSASNTIAKQEGQISEIGKLIACIQERQSDLDSKIEELRQLDIVCMFNEISEIRRTELENVTATKKQRVVELSAFGVCIVLGIAVLIRLLAM